MPIFYRRPPPQQRRPGAATAAGPQSYSEALTVSQATVALVAKQATKLLGPVAQAAAAGLQAIKTHLVSLSVAQATAATMQRGVNLTRALAQATQPALTKAVSLPLALAQATLATLSAVKQAGGTTINLVVTQPTQAALTKAAALSRLVGQATAPTLGKATGKALAAAQASLATLGALKVHLVALTVGQPTAAALGRGVGKALGATQGTLARVGKATAKGLASAQPLAVLLSAVRQGPGAITGKIFALPARLRTWVLPKR